MSFNFSACRPDGARTMNAQMAMDRKGTPLLKLWLEKSFGVTAQPTDKENQLRGSDLNVSHPSGNAEFVSMDGKFDTYATGNLTLEVISQDRGNKSRQGAARGWVGKDTSLVAYTFLQTGEILLLKMNELTPWLKEHLQPIADGMGSQLALLDSRPSGTPNNSYISYNVILSIRTLMRKAPGVEYVRMSDVLGTSVVERHLGPLAPFIYDVPPDSRCMGNIEKWLLQEQAYNAKEWFDDTENERLIRWFEEKTVFNKYVSSKAKQLQGSRQRFVLPED